MVFSETQSGKSSCDRMAAIIKRRVYNYLNSNHNVRTPREFFDAIIHNDIADPLYGISIFLAKTTSRDIEADPKKAKTQLSRNNQILRIRTRREWLKSFQASEYW